jgi:hypothetical protein
MSEAENKFVHHAVYTNGSADQIKSRVVGVIKDKMMEVEMA